VHITASSANADDFMPTRQNVYCSLANGTGGTYDNYLHYDIPHRTLHGSISRVCPIAS